MCSAQPCLAAVAQALAAAPPHPPHVQPTSQDTGLETDRSHQVQFGNKCKKSQRYVHASGGGGGGGREIYTEAAGGVVSQPQGAPLTPLWKGCASSMGKTHRGRGGLGSCKGRQQNSMNILQQSYNAERQGKNRQAGCRK